MAMAGGRPPGGANRELQEPKNVRFILVVVLLAIAALAGLYIYGELLKPDTQTIEQEAVSAAAP
jgi:hypothetical protein